MNLLLDTQIFIWAYAYPHKLPERIGRTLQNTENNLYLSVASSWEMQIKHQLGKLPLPMAVEEFVEAYADLNDITLIPIISQHVWTLNQLPFHHRDPFDRMIIAQAIAEKFTLVSVDRIFTQYPATHF